MVDAIPSVLLILREKPSMTHARQKRGVHRPGCARRLGGRGPSAPCRSAPEASQGRNQHESEQESESLDDYP